MAKRDLTLLVASALLTAGGCASTATSQGLHEGQQAAAVALDKALATIAAALLGLGILLAPAAVAAPHLDADPPSRAEAAAGMEVVVKFKDDRAVREIVHDFWVDAEAARKRFDQFKCGYPDLSAATLVRVTYSNELVLAFPAASLSREDRRAEMRELAARLGRLPGIAYAEPDYTVSTQGP